MRKKQIEVKSNVSTVHTADLWTHAANKAIKIFLKNKIKINKFLAEKKKRRMVKKRIRNYSHVNYMYKQVQTNKKWQQFNNSRNVFQIVIGRENIWIVHWRFWKLPHGFSHYYFRLKRNKSRLSLIKLLKLIICFGCFEIYRSHWLEGMCSMYRSFCSFHCFLFTYKNSVCAMIEMKRSWWYIAVLKFLAF